MAAAHWQRESPEQPALLSLTVFRLERAQGCLRQHVVVSALLDALAPMIVAVPGVRAQADCQIPAAKGILAPPMCPIQPQTRQHRLAKEHGGSLLHRSCAHRFFDPSHRLRPTLDPCNHQNCSQRQCANHCNYSIHAHFAPGSAITAPIAVKCASTGDTCNQH